MVKHAYKVRIFLVTLLLLLSSYIAAQTCTVQSASPGVLIPDDATTSLTQTVTFTSTAAITDVNVTIDITHSFDADLNISLTSPAGTTIDLSSDNGGAGDDYTNTVFDDAAATAITAGTAPFTGSFSPEQPLSNFNGENPNGVWTLTIFDDFLFDQGTLNSFSIEVCTADAPPVVTAIGNQNLCPGAGNTQNIATSISITDPDDTTTDAVYIQISSGYVNGEDLLTLTSPGSHPNITASFDAVQGELTLQGPTTFAEFEAAILDVVYSSSNAAATGTRQFSITPGTANYLPPTDHYYEFVTAVNITWTAANAAANARTLFGLQGYLATLTSQAEADFSGSQATGVGWIGGSDAATEGDWRWVTGPEGLENAGAGRQFWLGTAGGTTTAPDNFAFWNTGEPNQSGNEDYAHITNVNVTTMPGSWNDLPNTTATSGFYQAQGYVVEYGGSPGDPVLSISATTSITLVCSADLSLTKTVSNSTPNIGDNITFTITLTNSGPDTASGIQVRDIIPAGLINIVATPSAGTYTVGTGIWNLGTTLVSGASATLTISVDVGPSCTSITNTAEIISSSYTDPDSTPNNGG